MIPSFFVLACCSCVIFIRRRAQVQEIIQFKSALVWNYQQQCYSQKKMTAKPPCLSRPWAAAQTQHQQCDIRNTSLSALQSSLSPTQTKVKTRTNLLEQKGRTYEMVTPWNPLRIQFHLLHNDFISSLCRTTAVWKCCTGMSPLIKTLPLLTHYSCADYNVCPDSFLLWCNLLIIYI